MVFDIGTLCKLKDYHVRLTVNNEEYEGVITNVIPATLRIALGKARCLTDGVYYHVLYFFTYEIESCVTVNGPEDSKKAPKKQNNFIEEDGPRLVKLRPLPFHERGKPRVNVDTGNILIDGTDDKKQSEYLLDDISDKSDDDDDDILSSEKFRYPVPATNTIIDAVDDDFHQVISKIMKETTVGVSLEGANIGRHGKVCWILISTETHVYLFDVCALGEDAFDNGLREVLQNASILKIFHDCREPSDALFHLYGIRLVNIFDTQSSDALYQYKHHRRMPRFVRNLGTCLSDYLKINVRIPDFSKTNRQRHLEKNLSVWINRPLPKRFVKIAAKRCMFLKELRYGILERYLADLNYGAEIYLGIIREASEQELDLSRSSLHMLPAAFHKLEVKSKRDTLNHQSHEANFVNSSCLKLSHNTYDPYAAVSNSLPFKKSTGYMKDFAVPRTVNGVSQKNFEDEEHSNSRASGILNGKFDTESGASKTNGSSLTDENSVPALVSSRYENQFFARTAPKKRLDWPKVSSKTAIGTKNVTMMPAGMIPLSAQYPKKKQDC